MTERKDTPVFSVVTVCRNDLEGLQRTVESLLGQDEADWEQLIVDGASTDGTLDYLQSITDARIRWSSESDSGIYDAMNKGVASARGDLILIVNSGDGFASESSLSIYAQDRAENQWDWAYGSVRLTTGDGRVVGAYTFDPFNRQKFVMGINWIPFASVCFARSLMREVGTFRLDIGNAADQEYLMRALNVSSPRALTWYLGDYALGGLSQTVGPREREIAWHAMRRDNGNLWRESVLLDRIATELLAWRKPFRIIAKRIGTKP
jgi:glycosyltransferase involved in cell wall biosynthesis